MNKSVAYTAKEKLLLAELVRDNGVVENKKTDGATLIEKKKAWELISINYNSQPEVIVTRTPEQLRKLWNNLKQRKRRETTEERHSMLATGGGPPKKPNLDPLLQVVQHAAPSVDVDIDCPCDSTAVFEKEQTESRETVYNKQEGNSDCVLDDQIMEKRDISNYVTTKTPTTSRRNRRSVPAAIAVEADLRSKKIAEATQQQDELHKVRMQIVEEELQTAILNRKTAELLWQKASAEAELAKLNLELLKKKI